MACAASPFKPHKRIPPLFYQDEPTALLIDGKNFYSTACALDITVDWKLLHQEISRQCRLMQALYFTTLPKGEDEHDHIAAKPTLDWMEYNGWTVCTKPGRAFVDHDGRRKIKGNTDVELAVAAMKLTPHVGHIVLCTGKADYVPLVAYLQETGTRVTVLSSKAVSPPMIADDLRRKADDFIDLDDMRTTICRAIAA